MEHIFIGSFSDTYMYLHGVIQISLPRAEFPHLVRQLQICRWFKDAVIASNGMYQTFVTTSPCASGSCSECIKREGGRERGMEGGEGKEVGGREKGEGGEEARKRSS